MRCSSLLALVGVVVVTGCTSGAGKGLSISAGSHTGSQSLGAAVPPATAAAATNSIDAGSGILITRIRVLVARAELEGSPACPAPVMPVPTTTMPASSPARTPTLDSHGGGSSSGDSGGSGDGAGGGSDDGSAADGSDDHECEITGGPFLVDLSGAALTGGVTFVVDLAAPAGTYEELKFRIDTLSASQAGTDAGLLAMADAHASILVDGTIDGAPFQFATPMALVQKREGRLVVDPVSGANVTLDFDASGWFKSADGSKLDPASPLAQGAILANLRASLRLVSDDDHDGKEDGEVDGSGATTGD
jgi:hypothetical protein